MADTPPTQNNNTDMPHNQAPPLDEEMAEAPPLLEQNMPPAQLVDEGRMEEVEPTGLSTPLYTPSLPNKEVGQGPHFPTTPHQPTPLPMATPSTPVINCMIKPNSTGTIDYSSLELSVPQASHLYTTPQADLPRANPPEPPDTPNPHQITWNEPSPPPPPQDTMWISPSGPKDEIFGDPQDPRNIKSSPHPHQPHYDPNFQAYTTLGSSPRGQDEGVATNNNQIMQAYTLGLTESI